MVTGFKESIIFTSIQQILIIWIIIRHMDAFDDTVNSNLRSVFLNEQLTNHLAHIVFHS